MFEIVGEESEVEMLAGQHRCEVQPVRPHKVHISGQGRPDVSDVGGPTLMCIYVANEVAQVARDVEHARVRLDVSLQKLTELTPDRLFLVAVGLVEAEVVDLLQDDGREVAGGVLARRP